MGKTLYVRKNWNIGRKIINIKLYISKTGICSKAISEQRLGINFDRRLLDFIYIYT